MGKEGAFHTTDADSGTAVEGEILPSGSQGLPSLRLEVFGVFAVKVFSAVHGVERPLHCLAFGDEKGGLAVVATAAG